MLKTLNKFVSIEIIAISTAEKHKQTLNTMRITKSNHVTATERKHLRAFLSSGKTRAKVNTKYYEILSGTPIEGAYEYEIRIATKRKDDWGTAYFDKQTITVQWNG